MWVFRDEEKILRTVMITEIRSYPRRKAIVAVLAVGEHLLGNMDLITSIEQSAALSGIDFAMVEAGRTGWEKPLVKLGYTRHHTIYSKTISPQAIH